MSTFLNQISGKLTDLEQKIQSIPGECSSILERLDAGKWRNLLARVDRDRSELLDRLSTPRNSGVLTLPLIMDLDSGIRPITTEDIARWRAAHEADVRVVIGKGQVRVMADSDITGEKTTAVHRIEPALGQQNCVVLSWDRYQQLADEIGRLLNGGDE